VPRAATVTQFDGLGGGSGAFVFTDSARTHRIQVAVNSAAQQDVLSRLTDVSVLAAITDGASASFIDTWHKTHALAMCGLDLHGASCQ
jgi:hypothetical protein